MCLNDYRDEVKEFLVKINSFGVNQKQKLMWIEKEFKLLKSAVKNSDNKAIFSSNLWHDVSSVWNCSW